MNFVAIWSNYCIDIRRAGGVLRDQVGEAQALVQLAHENQAAVGSNPLELTSNAGLRELKGLICCFTHWVAASAPSSSRAKSASINTFDVAPGSAAHTRIGNPGDAYPGTDFIGA
jgi:hypothetical protein